MSNYDDIDYSHGNLAAAAEVSEPVSPLRYKLSIRLEPQKGTFDGTVTILLRVFEPTDTIWLHCCALSISGARIIQNKKTYVLDQNDANNNNNNSSSSSSSSTGNNSMKICLHLENPISVGKAELVLGFKGKIKDELNGIFRIGPDGSTIGGCGGGGSGPAATTAKGSKKGGSGSGGSGSSANCIIATHFEPHFARTAFPCFDDYMHKAVFELELVIPKNYTAVSNTPMIREVVQSDGTKCVGFAETPKMSTYLLTFAVGEFDVVREMYNKKLPLGIYVPKGAKYPTDLVMRTSLEGLNMCEKLFKIEYPLAKLDIVIVPRLCLGGMEGWGCIFLNLADTAPQGKVQKGKAEESLVELILHEIAHQWVGDLVSLPFWCKEGLAMYLDKTMCDKLLKRKPDISSSSSSKPSTAATTTATITATTTTPTIAKKNDPKQQQQQCCPPPTLLAGNNNNNNTNEMLLSQEFAELFNGIMYQRSLTYVRERVDALGMDVFQERLHKLLSDNQFECVDEETFIKTFA